MKALKRSYLRIISGVVLSVLILMVGYSYYLIQPNGVAVSISNEQPIYNGNRRSNKIALMFNCYEGREIILKIANLLEEFNFKATFFFGGCFADDNIDIIQKLYETGNEIGNHGYFHKEHGKLDYNGNYKEIKNTHDYILAQTGIDMNLFAPPSGDFSKITIEVCESLDYKVILWSKDTIDWRDKNEKIVYNRATKNVVGGDFILMHPKEHTYNALKDILNFYLQSGFIVATVSECMENNG